MLTPCPKTLQNATRYLPGSFETVMWQFQNPPVNGPPLPCPTPSPRGVGPWGPAGSATRRAHARRARGGQPVGGARDRSDLHRRSCGARSTRGSVGAPTQCSDLHTGAGGTARAPTSTPPEAEPPPTAGGRGHGERTGTTARAQRAAGRAAAFSWRLAFCRRSDEVDRHVRRVVAGRCCRKIMIIDQ